MTNFVENFEKITRDITLSMLMGEYSLKSDLKKLKRGSNLFFNKPQWKIIQKHKDNCIITGSCALMAYGLIDRYPEDVDLILMDEKSSIINKLNKDRYPGLDLEDMYGFYLARRGIYVDFFKYKNQSYSLVDGLMIQNPIEVLKTKIDIFKSELSDDRRKDLYDVYYALKNIGYDI